MPTASPIGWFGGKSPLIFEALFAKDSLLLTVAEKKYNAKAVIKKMIDNAYLERRKAFVKE